MDNRENFMSRASRLQLMRDWFKDFSMKALKVHPHIFWELASIDNSLHSPKYNQHPLLRRNRESGTSTFTARVKASQTEVAHQHMSNTLCWL
jgi:hypothetical protein